MRLRITSSSKCTYSKYMYPVEDTRDKQIILHSRALELAVRLA